MKVSSKLTSVLTKSKKKLTHNNLETENLSRVKTYKKKMDFSRKILVVTSLIVALIISVSLFFMWSLGDLSSLNEIIIGSFAMLTAVTGFVIWKEKNESLVQLMKENPELTDEVREELQETLEENIDKDFN